MYQERKEDEQRRDELLMALLHTLPQPRPERKHGEGEAALTQDRAKPATAGTPEPSA